jgi:ParB-like chromosome segregation protein Spo0J
LRHESANLLAFEVRTRTTGLAFDGDDLGAIVTVPISSLRPGESPRLQGEDKAHIARLLDLETTLPPILVERRTMRVIDGMHRLMAASLRGQDTVEVRFFEGSAADAFLRGVKENVAHGLPLSLADRRAAAARIICSHPQLSDRALGETAGLSARTVASIRRRAASTVPLSTTRIGRDGKVRPLSGVEGRQRVAELLAEQPEASLRELARRAGVSPATVRDVRQRLARSEEPVPVRVAPAPASAPVPDDMGETTPELPSQPWSTMPPEPADTTARVAQSVVLEKLLRDPSLRHSESGRFLLRLLQLNAIGERQLPRVLVTLSPHCIAAIAVLARRYGEMWLRLSCELDERVRIIDPWSGG